MALPYELIVAEDLHRGIGTAQVTMPAGGTAVGTKLGLHTWMSWYNVKDFGAVGDNITDDTQAFKDAIATAIAAHHACVFIPVGEYIISDVLYIHEGIAILGAGSQGSTEQYGTTIKHRSNGDCFVFDGNGAPNAGTGGQLKNLLIVKAGGYSGGSAVKLVGTDDNHRPGETVLENLLIYGLDGTGLWDRGIHIDGTANNTPGGRGVRSTLMHKVRVADCSTDNQYIYLNQATHVVITYGEVDGGHGTGLPGLTIEGHGDNMMFSGLNINGTLQINGSDTVNVVITGRISTLDVNNPYVIGAIVAQCSDGCTNQSTLLRVVSNLGDAFLAKRVTELTNVTGDGTIVTVICDSEVYDKNNGYDPSTGIYTAKATGMYFFAAAVAFRAVGVAHTRFDIYLDHLRSGSTIASYAVDGNAYAQADPSGNVVGHLSVSEELLEGDTMRFRASVGGGAKTVSVGVTASTIYTWFTGKLLA